MPWWPGYRPIGPVFAIEQVQRNVLLELSKGDRRPAVACLQRVLADLNEQEREMVRTHCSLASNAVNSNWVTAPTPLKGLFWF